MISLSLSFYVVSLDLSATILCPRQRVIRLFHSDLCLGSGPYAGCLTRSKALQDQVHPRVSLAPVTVPLIQPTPTSSRHAPWIHLFLFSCFAHINLLATNKLRTHALLLHKLFLCSDSCLFCGLLAVPTPTESPALMSVPVLTHAHSSTAVNTITHDSLLLSTSPSRPSAPPG